MPIYKYVVVNDDGSDGDVFEVEQSIASEPIKVHPESGRAVRRVYDAPNINFEYTAGREKSLSDMTRIKKAGFRVLEKDKISGKYFEK